MWKISANSVLANVDVEMTTEARCCSFSWVLFTRSPRLVQLTRIVFHKRRSTFLMGKWGELPAQNFRTISIRTTHSKSSPMMGWPKTIKTKRRIQGTGNIECCTKWECHFIEVCFLIKYYDAKNWRNMHGTLGWLVTIQPKCDIELLSVYYTRIILYYTRIILPFY